MENAPFEFDAVLDIYFIKGFFYKKEHVNSGATMKTAGSSIFSPEAKLAKSLFAQSAKLIWYSHRSIGFSFFKPPI